MGFENAYVELSGNYIVEYSFDIRKISKFTKGVFSYCTGDYIDVYTLGIL